MLIVVTFVLLIIVAVVAASYWIDRDAQRHDAG